MLHRSCLPALLAIWLAACATVTPEEPARPTVLRDPGANAQWQNLGVNPNGNILHELDKQSLVRHGHLVTFRDRKTIFNLKRETFGQMPRHKVSVNSWRIDCQAQSYQLLASTLYDENGRTVASHTYNDGEIKPAAIPPNSASHQQMQFVCARP